MDWTDLKARVEAWVASDPDADSRAELQALLDAGEASAEELGERFSGPLRFGTAGLRGILGAGETRMNRAVVIRTAYGLGRYLLEVDAPAAKERGVVVGYDGRRLSRTFAEDTTAVLTALGIPVRLAVDFTPTPLLAFAVCDHAAVAGVMVTASHNPPEYNGYKVYAANGAQIIPPMDRGIAGAIDVAPPAAEISLETNASLVTDLGAETDRRYLDAVRSLSLGTDGDRTLGVVYTPLHGVGDALTRRALDEAGFTNVHTVKEQQKPDGEFPTVAFPNPEEDGALDLAMSLADSVDAPLIIANDPDADRLAAVVRTGGKTTPLTGNELGVILGHTLLTRSELGRGADDDPNQRLVAVSIVSSPQLGVIAGKLGVRYEEVLTGFKWIANRALELAPDGANFVFGYEEALGYTVGTVVRDKDGISAAMVLCELAASLHAKGETLLDELERIARDYGLYVSGQRSTRYPGSQGPHVMAAIMERLRANPPSVVGGIDVLAVRDYITSVRTAKGGETSEITLPKSNVLTFELAGGNRIIARPSGTEPKIKFYFDVREDVADGEGYGVTKARAHAAMNALADAFCEITA